MSETAKKEIKKRLTSIFLWSSFLLFATFFWFGPRKVMYQDSLAYLQSNENRFYLEELSDGLALNQIFSTTDESGVTQDAFVFQIVNETEQEITYEVYFQNKEERLSDPAKALSNHYLRYQLIVNGEAYPIQNLAQNGKIAINSLQPHTKDVYELRVWLDEFATNEAANKEFYGVVATTMISNV